MATYTPSIPDGTHVRLIRKDHPLHALVATVMDALPNPSGRKENQWYDVKFENARYGRFQERYLERVDDEKHDAA
jgi:hypothetical protein